MKKSEGWSRSLVMIMTDSLVAEASISELWLSADPAVPPLMALVSTSNRK